MMAQSTKPKLSSRAAMVLRRVKLKKATLDELAEVVDELMPLLTYPARRDVLVDLANVRDGEGIDWFWRRWKDGFWPETAQDLFELRNELRKVWMFSQRDDPTEWVNPFVVLNKWLAWRPTPAQMKKYGEWGEQFREGERLLGVSAKPYEYIPFFCSSQIDKLVPNPNCLRATLVQGVFEHLKHFSYCANSDCAAPYFIAKRADQIVCDAQVCKAERQREHARKWWTTNRARSFSAKAVKGT